LSWDDIAWICDRWRGILVLKCVLAAEVERKMAMGGCGNRAAVAPALRVPSQPPWNRAGQEAGG